MPPRRRSAANRARLSRGAAQEQIGALVDRLSADLLHAELSAFAAIAREWQVRTEAAVRVVVAARTVDRLAGDGNVLRRLHRVLDDAVSGAVVPTRRLVEDSVEMALDSLDRELTLAESTVSARYRGVVAAGIGDARAESGDLVGLSVDSAAEAFGQVFSAFAADYSTQIGHAANRAETMDDVSRRLFDPEHVGLYGNNGRGVWWRPVTYVQAQARAASIGASNEARTRGMVYVNAYYDERA